MDSGPNEDRIANGMGVDCGVVADDIEGINM